MYRLMKLEGAGPVLATELNRSHDWRGLEAERDSLTDASFADAGPGSMTRLRYGVWPL
jgi:hypothetical protein